jgi:hypothetical protein
MKYDWTTAEAWGKSSAALIASTVLYLSFCVACVTGVPMEKDVGLAIGALAGFPVWIGAACYAVLARTMVRAWGFLLGISLLLTGWAMLVLSVR